MLTILRKRAIPLLGLALAGAACRGGDPQAQGPGGVPVKIEAARIVTVDDSNEYMATLKSRRSAAIMPQVEGHVTRIFVRSGDRVALGTLAELFPNREVVGIHCLDLVWGLGTLHCMTQQEPAV